MKASSLLKAVVTLCLTFTLLASTSSFTVRTAAQNPKEPTIDDAFVREAGNRVRLKSGFVAEKLGKSRIVVRRASTNVVVGGFTCGSCPGGACEAGIIRQTGLSCDGCGSTNNTNCTINPFR